MTTLEKNIENLKIELEHNVYLKVAYDENRNLTNINALMKEINFNLKEASITLEKNKGVTTAEAYNLYFFKFDGSIGYEWIYFPDENIIYFDGSEENIISNRRKYKKENGLKIQYVYSSIRKLGGNIASLKFRYRCENDRVTY